MSALTPPPLCSGTPMTGKFAVWDATDEGGGYVSYRAEHDDNDRVRSVLEHCQTGRAVVADARWDVDTAQPDYADNVRDALDDFVTSSQTYTFRQMVAGLKSRGIKARTTRVRAESCGCAAFYPDQRGTRTPYK